MAENIYSVEEIRELLPYQYPMILVDKVWYDEDGNYFGLKNVTVTEEFFNGHFPNHPIMPGVLQVEAAQQVASIALKKELNPNGDLELYVKSMSKIKFRNPVNPGDRLLISVNIAGIEDNVATVKFENKSNSGVCTQGTITISARKKVLNKTLPDLFNEFDKDADVHMDVNKLKEYMPHRYPFLFIDYIKSIEGSKTVAIKNVTYNDPILHSYSSGYSVLPASIQAEIIAQAGCAPTLSRPENKGKLAFSVPFKKLNFITLFNLEIN